MSSSTSYKSNTAPTVSSAVATFFEEFFATSDDGSAGNAGRYADNFTNDGTLVMGLAEAKGREAIVKLREKMWTGPVASRLHTIEKIYSFGDNDRDVMLFGRVKYGLKNDKTVYVNWAARAQLEDQNGGKLKMSFYQVYLDSSVVPNAMKD